MKINTIYNEDALATMKRIGKGAVDIILTSPPYNTSRKGAKDLHNSRYDVYEDSIPEEDYINFTIDIFKGFDSILKEDGVVLYNLSYSTDNPDLETLVVADVIRNTPFTLVDKITWKKDKAQPNNVSPSRLTRIVETIYVLCRKSEVKTFKSNKKFLKHNKAGQRIYGNVYNFIEAKNNDGPNKLNKATFSSELVTKLLEMYVPKEFSVVYDPFMGTGTTARAALKKKMFYIGSEISEQQVAYAGTSKKMLDEKERRNYIIDMIYSL